MTLIVADNINKDYRVGEITIPASKGLSFGIWAAFFYNVLYLFYYRLSPEGEGFNFIKQDY